LKKYKILVTVLVVFAFLLSSCDNDLKNLFRFRNNSQSDLTINFRGNHYQVSAGTVYDIKDTPKGTYEYSTIYRLPAGVKSYSSEGELSGQVDFQQGTTALIIYTSTYLDSAYTIFATLTTNTDLSDTEGVTAP
jgi:hypothetical protein